MPLAGWPSSYLSRPFRSSGHAIDRRIGDGARANKRAALNQSGRDGMMAALLRRIRSGVGTRLRIKGDGCLGRKTETT